MRAWNIALRTIHILVTGVLVGGHMFGVEPERLVVWLYAALASGAGLAVVEAYPDWRWFCEARAWMVLAKVALTALIAWQWNYRIIVLLLIVAIGSVGSHMPKRFRHYRILHRAMPTDTPERDCT